MIVDNIRFNTPTPITLINFQAIKNNSNVNINWQTVSEINNDYFVLEKSKDGIEFNAIENIKGAGNSNVLLNYNIIDYTPYNGISYYRLKQVDYTGIISYSKITSIFFNEKNNIYPNPTYGIINFTGTEDISNIIVYNNIGEIISINIISNTLDLSDYPIGIYFININHIVYKIIKQ